MEQQCPSCKSEMKLREGFSKKNGKPYSFWGCTNFPACTQTLPNLNKVAPLTQNPPQIAKQSDKTAFETEVVSLLKEIRDELRKPKFPEPEEDLSQFGV